MIDSISFRVVLLACAPVWLSACASHPADIVPENGPSAAGFPAAAFAETCERWDDWDKPAPPFRLYGGTYHVGTCGISSILITGPEGHLLIDSGTERGAELVAANIEALGLSLGDVRFLTHTQEHFDHVGGLAQLQQRFGARVLASERARPVLESGVVDTDDPQYGLHDPMARAGVDATVADGDVIRVGDKDVLATYTPGHSPGAISWRWQECENGRCYDFVFTDGMSPVAADGYRWSDHPEYLADFRASLEWLATTGADICLSAHPSGTRLIERIEAGSVIDPVECGRYAAATMQRLDGIIAAERAR